MSRPSRLTLPALLAALQLVPISAAPAQEPAGPVIGIAAPLSGPSEILGRQLLAGARTAASQATPAPVAIVEGDTQCTGEGGADVARAFVAAKVAAVAGFLCTEALDSALPILTQAGIPVVDVGVRANRFTARRDRTHALIWRIAPTSRAEANAAAALVENRWRDVPFGMIDDGTIYGRGLSDAVRAQVEAAGMRPATVDNYRPAEEKQFGLARRLLATGVTRLFVAGERADAAIIARDAASIGLDLEIIGGEALIDEPPSEAELPIGALAVAPAGRFPALATPDTPAEGYFGPAYAAVEIAVQALDASRASGKPMADILNTTRFQTRLGPISFDGHGDGNLDLFRTFGFDGTDFSPEAGG